jgi:hypothetical protein
VTVTITERAAIAATRIIENTAATFQRRAIIVRPRAMAATMLNVKRQITNMLRTSEIDWIKKGPNGERVL